MPITNNSQKPYSVSELNRSARKLLQASYFDILVEGEISNLARPASGHVYFSLKDDSAQLRCVFFKQRRLRATVDAEDGAQVIVRGQISLYEQRGDYQFIVHNMLAAGVGVLQREFEKLKDKLKNAGLFASGHKLDLPAMPHRIGVITSPSGAAVRDVLTTLNKRYPQCPVLIYPSLVQGESAAQSLTKMVELANEQSHCDVLILCRGGGSLEDLWAFNNEKLAYAIHHSKIPIVSGVGHETDFTIADFVADLRAATPTAAAVVVSPDAYEMKQRLAATTRALAQMVQNKLENAAQSVDWLTRRIKHPKQLLREYQNQLRFFDQQIPLLAKARLSNEAWGLQDLRSRLADYSPAQKLAQLTHRLELAVSQLNNAIAPVLLEKNQQLALLNTRLNSVNPNTVLQRGYAILQTGRGKVVSDPRQVKSGDVLRATVAKGVFDVGVRNLAEKEDG